MADVAARKPGRPVGSKTGSQPDRGQLILVTALSLAILFVALALILNTAIYTENLATRSSDIGGGTDAVRYHDAARASVDGIIDFVNAHNNSSFDTLTTNLSAGVSAFSNQSSRQFAHSDRAVSTTLNESVNGSRIAQTYSARNFTNKSGVADWTVASGVKHTRAVKFHIDRTPLLNLLSGSPFRMILTDGSNTWQLTVRRTGLTDITIDVAGTSASGSCSVSASDAWVNVSEGTFGGQRCKPLDSFASGLTNPYDIRFENSSEVSGGYTMIVDSDVPAKSPGPNLYVEGAGQPYAANAIYSVTVDVVYDTARLRYQATVRVAPGEP